jgi:transcriptional regulator with XRE-family HTH domain
MPKTNRPYVTKRSSPLAALRVRAELTGKAAAAELGMKPPRLANIEHGVRASDEILARMATVYRVTLTTVRRAYLSGRREFILREKP